jgi:hypothetical protein
VKYNKPETTKENQESECQDQNTEIPDSENQKENSRKEFLNQDQIVGQ